MKHAILRDILAQTGAPAPDGRLLHAYETSSAHFAAMEAALQGVTALQKRQGAVAGLYVLWAAERIRSHYDGSGLSWEFINAPLPGIFEGTTIAGFVRLGLDQWLRPLRRGLGGSQLYMYSLLAEGGIPLAVLESARQHAQVLRQMIDEIGSRGGVAVMGYETAFELARQKMRYLPRLLHHRDSIGLFVDLAQAIFDLREALPPGLPAEGIEGWLDSERPGWQRDLPLRLTPQIIDNIIRPSLTAARVKERPNSAPAQREIHLSEGGLAQPVAILAPHAALPLVALPGAETTVLRLVPRFATRRPLVYRAMKSTESPNREIERLGGTGPEVVSLGLFASLDFDVMADSQSLGTWSALTALSQPAEAVSLWAGQEMLGGTQRLRPLSGGRTRAGAIWAALPKGAEADTDGGLALGARLEIEGASLIEIRGQGVLRLGDQALRIATGAEADSEAAALFFFGKTLANWRLPGGEPVYLGHPMVYGQRGEGALTPLPGGQLRRSPRRGSLYGAEFCEWLASDERLAIARAICLPAHLKIEAQENAAGGLTLLVTGLPEGVLLDARAGELVVHGRSGGGALTMPPRPPAVAYVTLTLTEIATGKRLDLSAPWPSPHPHFIRNGAVLPQRDLDLSFDELAGLSYLAPGPYCRMTIDLTQGRSFQLPVVGMAPLVRQEALLRKLLAQGSADNVVSLKLHNSAGQTGRINLRRYHSQMALQDDRLTLGLDADLPRGGMWDPVQRPGEAVLHLLQIETGEEQELTVALTDRALYLRQASGIESGFWLVQGRFDGLQQRPVAWRATLPDPAHPNPRTSREARIAAYRSDMNRQGRQGGAAAPWKPLLRLILAARDGGDPAMLDQFHALAEAPPALARMLFALPAADVSSLFALDSHWNVFWPAIPVADLVAVARDMIQGTTDSLVLANMKPSMAAAFARGGMIERLVLLRSLRPDLLGHIALILIETGLIVDVARDTRFDGIFLPQPQKALDEAVQTIARSDPSLPLGLKGLEAKVLPMPNKGFQSTVQLTIGAVLATAEASMGLRDPLGAAALLDVSLIETAAPDLFSRALHPAMLIALTLPRT